MLHLMLCFALALATARGLFLGLSTRTEPTTFAASLRNLSTGQRLEKILPIAWVHVPKCGAVILNTAMHLPGVCPGLPRDLMLCSHANPSCEASKWVTNKAGGFVRLNSSAQRVPKACPGIQRWCEHDGFDEQYKRSGQGHGLIMLRQPEQRLISAYYNPGGPHGWNVLGVPKHAGLLDYARAWQGAAVKTLTRSGEWLHWQAGAPSWDETNLAKARLREGFAFVGISEHTELSICLLHKMFGNVCRRKEFGNFHRGLRHKPQYKLEALGGFVDEHDGALYAEALRIFEENLKAYNVSKESCQVCFREAGSGHLQL